MESGLGVVEDEISALKKRVAAFEVRHNNEIADLAGLISRALGHLAAMNKSLAKLEEPNGEMPCDNEPMP